MFDLDVVNAFSKGTVVILKSYFNSNVGKGSKKYIEMLIMLAVL